MTAKPTAKPVLPAAILRKFERLTRREAAMEAAIKRNRLALADELEKAVRELRGENAESEQHQRSKPRVARKRRRRKAGVRIKKSELAPAKTAAVRRSSEGSWTETMLKIIETADRPLTYAELRNEVAKTHLGPKLAQTEKSFYGGIGKLAGRKQIVRHGGRVFSHRAYERFRRDLEAGIIKDEPVRYGGRHSSPVKTALLALLERNPLGATPSVIIASLERDSGQKLDRNGKTAIYNLISRLVKRGDLVRQGPMVHLPLRHNGAAPASDNITGRPAGIEPVRQSPSISQTAERAGSRHGRPFQEVPHSTPNAPLARERKEQA